MKSVLFLLFSACSQLASYAQVFNKAIYKPNDLSSKYIKLNTDNTAPAGLHFTFSTIKITDSRFDTSKLGFIPSKEIFRENFRLYQKLGFKTGTAKALEDYYNFYYKSSFSNNGLSLYIVMKKWWLTSTIDNRTQENATALELNSLAKMYVKWEL